MKGHKVHTHGVRATMTSKKCAWIFPKRRNVLKDWLSGITAKPISKVI